LAATLIMNSIIMACKLVYPKECAIVIIEAEDNGGGGGDIVFFRWRNPHQSRNMLIL
jgi:hypothetical protein